MQNFVISDTHFNHAKIIQYCSRPFENVEEMNEALIWNWNSVVGADDYVYHLGDFGFGSISALGDIRKRLNGEILLIRGNHDSHSKHTYEKIGLPVIDRLTISPPGVLFKCYLSHRPSIEKRRGEVHLHGHLHRNELEDNPFWNVNMSVELWDYTPQLLTDVIPAAVYQEMAHTNAEQNGMVIWGI